MKMRKNCTQKKNEVLEKERKSKRENEKKIPNVYTLASIVTNSFVVCIAIQKVDFVETLLKLLVDRYKMYKIPSLPLNASIVCQ